jgi:hypothetical protein
LNVVPACVAVQVTEPSALTVREPPESTPPCQPNVTPSFGKPVAL